MQLGFVTAILPELSLQELMELAADIGYSCIEVMCWPVGAAERRYAGVTHLDVTSFDSKDVDAVHQLIRRTGVTISGLGYYPNPLRPDKEESRSAVAHIYKLIEAASKLDIQQVNSFVGRDWHKSVEDNWPLFLDTWKPIFDFAESKNVRIGIENCPMYFTADEWPGGKNLKTTPAIWRKMYKDIPSKSFGLNFDPSHFIWQKMDYIRPVIEFSDKLFHIHAKDAVLDLDRLKEVGVLAHPNEYHTPKIPGKGDVDWLKFFDALKTVGYDGAVCVEVEDRSYEGSLAMRKESLRDSFNYLSQFFA